MRAAPIPFQILSGTGRKYNTDTRAAVAIESKFSLNLVHLYTDVYTCKFRSTVAVICLNIELVNWVQEQRWPYCRRNTVLYRQRQYDYRTQVPVISTAGISSIIYFINRWCSFVK